MKKILVSFGTRPEAIKLAPIIAEARVRGVDVKVLVTGQHQEMLDPFLDFFGIQPDYRLNVLKPNQSLADLTAAIVSGVTPILKTEKPDLVFVQGDTTTTFSTALAAFYEKIPVGHIEAGLRTHHLYSPFPEELNRTLVSKIAEYHFAPTEQARKNLAKEGIERNVSVTGNTGIDALRMTLKTLGLSFSNASPSILITCHRRENHGQPLEEICDAILELSKNFPDHTFEFPVHLNPNVQHVVRQKLGGRLNIQLTQPLNYVEFVTKMAKAKVILTDSGGVQEEAPYLKKPIFVLRESTERSEGIDAGVAELVGTQSKKIVEQVTRALTDQNYYESFHQAVSPYGDGFAAKKIFDLL